RSLLSYLTSSRFFFFTPSAPTEIDPLPYTTLFRSAEAFGIPGERVLPLWDWVGGRYSLWSAVGFSIRLALGRASYDRLLAGAARDRKSTRLNSSHVKISYAVFCLKKKRKTATNDRL